MKPWETRGRGGSQYMEWRDYKRVSDKQLKIKTKNTHTETRTQLTSGVDSLETTCSCNL